MKEFVEKLREKADVFEKSGCAVDGIVKDYRKSADMIEKLYKKSNISGFVEKLIERLEEEKNTASKTFAKFEMKLDLGRVFGLEKAIEIVNQLAEEYNQDSTKNTQGWIPCEERYPDNGDYILLSFANFSIPMVGRYEDDAYGGAFYVGDEEESCVSQGMYVNAWQPLPKPYEREE